MLIHLSSIDRSLLTIKEDEQALDDALACTFPASDPVSITFHTSVRRSFTDTKPREEVLESKF